jgi:hypothetical protein
VSAAEYVELGIFIQSAVEIFWISESSEPGKSGRPLEDSEKEDLTDALKRMLHECEKLQLYTSSALISSRLAYLPKTLGEFELLRDAVQFEMTAKLFLFVPQHIAKYYEWGEIVNEKVTEAFPNSYQKIRAAGSCLASGLPTACVFHSMRAAELGLKALGSEYEIAIKSGKEIALAEWREILDGLNATVQKIENLPNSTIDKDVRLQFCSEAAAEFRFFKNGWRIRAAHARATYDEAQAIEVIDHVRSFFEFLATRLKE